MSPLREQLLKTANGYITSFNENTPEGTIAHRSPNCMHYMLPTWADIPPRSNAEYQAFIAQGFQVLKNFHLKLKDGVSPIIDEEQRKVVLHLTSTADTPIGPYTNQYVFTFQMSSDGTQIDEVVEFVDPKYTKDFVDRVIEYLTQHPELIPQQAGNKEGEA
ncbi:hypothetical protein GQ53DRAFT_327188 [Thozetella sp. PMI_491]|nr:hypothetical protein GQ53DRAFT_327188 [Thozetella sp. PMI_491]